MDDLTTLADLATINDMNARDVGATEIFNAAPLLAALNAVESTNGASHTYEVYEGAPVVGFRQPNAGRNHSKSNDRLETIGLNILDASFHKDAKLVAIDKKRGEAGHMAREANRHLSQALRTAEEQLIYGLGKDAEGFAGLVDSYSALANAMVLNAGGGAAGDRTSVWAIRTVGDESGANVVLGDGEIQIRPYFEQFVEDDDGRKYPALMQPIDGWVGMVVSTANCVARLVNVGGNKTLNDAMLSDLLTAFEEEAPATHICLLYTSPSPRDRTRSRMPSSA